MKSKIALLSCAFAVFLSGCGGGIEFIDISQKAPIAVVSFSLNKSIVEDGKERDRGPGLLQKAENYYKNHRIAIDSLWSDFKTGYREMFLGAEAIDIETIVSNEKYRELTKHVPKMMLGVDMAPGADVLTANSGLNFAPSSDNAIMDQIAALANAKLLMCIEYTGSYAMSSGISIAGIGAGAAKMKLSADIILYEPGKGIVLRKIFSESSDESFPMVGGILLSENYAKGFSSAQKKLLPQIKYYLQDQQAKAKAMPPKA